MKDGPDNPRVTQKLAATHVSAPGAVAEAGRPSGIGDRAIGLVCIQTSEPERPRRQAEVSRLL
jgi:hypothetical protein